MTDDLFPVTPAEKVACIEREIAMRERVYPRWVEQGRMTQSKADSELRIMRAVLEGLEADATEL